MAQSFDPDKYVQHILAHRHALLILSALAGFGLAILLIGKLVFSGFSILDDHQIAGWLGVQHRVHFTDLWSMMKDTDIGQYGVGARFRPVMYFLIVLETWLWGAHPIGFHLLAVIWFGVFLWSVAWVSFRTIGIIPGCVILFLVASGPYWGNIWTHSTMVSEQTASLGLGLAIFGFGLTCSWFVDGCRGRIDTAVLLVGAGSVIALGSKENFMALMGLDILLVALAWRMKAIGSRTLAISIVLILVDLAFCYGIIVPNIGKPTDFYGYDNHFGYRLSTVPHSPLFKKVLLALAAGAFGTFWGWRNIARRDDRDDRRIAVWGMFLLVAGFYLAWEIFVYDGRLPMGQRYDFPALLINPILAGAAFYLVGFVSARTPWIHRQFSPLALQVCFALLFLSVAVLYRSEHRLMPLVAAIRISNSHTALMSNDLGRTRALAMQHQDWPVIVSPTHPLDYEAVVTFPMWLRYFGTTNPASIFVDMPPQNIKTPFDELLVNTMRTESKDGRKGLYQPRTDAITQAQAEGHCYIVQFDDRPTPCVRLPYHPGEYYPVD